MVGRAGHRNSGRASRADDGPIKIWAVANYQSRLRFDDDQIHGLVSDETTLRFRVGGPAHIDRFFVLRSACVSDEVRKLAASCRLCTDAFAGADHGDVGAGHSIFPDGVAGRDAGAHLSRVTGEADLCSEGEDQFHRVIVGAGLVPARITSYDDLQFNKLLTKRQH